MAETCRLVVPRIRVPAHLFFPSVEAGLPQPRELANPPVGVSDNRRGTREIGGRTFVRFGEDTNRRRASRRLSPIVVVMKPAQGLGVEEDLTGLETGRRLCSRSHRHPFPEPVDTRHGIDE
jgi:hypothetical protein